VWQWAKDQIKVAQGESFQWRPPMPQVGFEEPGKAGLSAFIYQCRAFILTNITVLSVVK